MISRIEATSIHQDDHPVYTPPLHWLSVVAHLDPRFGGLSAAVPRLSSSVTDLKHNHVSLAAFCLAGESGPEEAMPALNTTRWPLSRKTWLKDRSYSQRFNELARSMDGVHIHGLWEQSSSIAAKVARANKLPYVVSAHGMLEPWALANKKWKKRIYSAIIERSNVRKAACLHALTQAEADNYRDYCGGGVIAVIPNGVDVPLYIAPDLFFSRYPNLQGKRLVLFLGRIHFKKGLDILIKAWPTIQKDHPDAHLVLAGPDSENTQAAIAAMIRESKLEASVTFTGMLDNRLKWSAFAAAECFVLPSYSEGLSISVLEAMGAGLPVIVSDRCNLPEIAQEAAGWVIPARQETLLRSLEELLENRSFSNKRIGANGRDLVQKSYTWKRVGEQMSELYTWVAGGNWPSTVELQNAGRNR